MSDPNVPIDAASSATDVEPCEHPCIKPRRLRHAHQTQNFILVWLDDSIDKVNNEQCVNTIFKLKEITNNVYTFTDIDECIEFVSDIRGAKTFVITSDVFGRKMIPTAQKMSQISAVYIYCKNKAHFEESAMQWSKVKSVCTDVVSICEMLTRVAQQYDHNTTSISFVASSIGDTNPDLDQLDQSFMYTQILKEILLTIDFEQKHITEFITYCREQFADSVGELKHIDKLEQEYHEHVPIWWYTSPSFLYSTLNGALRNMEVDTIINMGFFIQHLHQNIATIHAEQFAVPSHLGSFVAYRGQGLPRTDFVRLMKTQGGLLSFNNFLSTSLNRTVSLFFAESNAGNSDMVGILFQIAIDSSISAAPFAKIREVSYIPDEEEILFSMHSIFRIGHIDEIDENEHLWQVDLTLTDDHDPQLHTLTEHIRKKTFPSQKGWYRLASLLVKLGQFHKAEQVCELLLSQTQNDQETANIHHLLGIIVNKQGKYVQAFSCYKQSLKIYQNFPPIRPTFAAYCDSLGLVYRNMGKYTEALSYYQTALENRQKKSSFESS
jgi:tetratricopeptide (TPR) repeat protein